MKRYLFAGLLLCIGVFVPLACGRLNRPAPRNPAVVSESVPRQEILDLGTIRIATYNVHMEPGDAIASAIVGNDELSAADVLFLQEIEDHDGEGRPRAQQVAEILGMSFAYAPGYGLAGGGSHGVAILSRYPLSDLKSIELPYFNVVVNSARRVALGATIVVRGQDVRVFSVHLDNRINPKKRKRQLEPVLAAARSFSGPVIIAGDLNTSPFCWLGHLVPIPCGTQDNAVEQGARQSGMKTPVAGAGSTSTWLWMRLDAVYTKGFVPHRRAVERSVRLSDHYPMWIDLELSPSPS